jgi:hypothetical protein
MLTDLEEGRLQADSVEGEGRLQNRPRHGYSEVESGGPHLGEMSATTGALLTPTQAVTDGRVRLLHKWHD